MSDSVIRGDHSRRSARGAVYTVGGQIARMLIGLVASATIARLVAPSDFGYMAMVVAVAGISEIVRDFGLYNAAIRAPRLDQQQQSNLFWTNLALGGALTISIVACARPIATFYDQPRLFGIALAFAPIFLINGASTQFRARLTRELRFGLLSAIEVATQLAGAGAGVLLALQGYGYWALVGQQLVFAALGLVLCALGAHWAPSWPRNWRDTRSHLAYGGQATLQQILNYVARNVDSIVIGRRFGAAQLGQYDRAYQVLMLPIAQLNAPLTRVALPTLSRAFEVRTGFEAKMVRAQAIALYVTVPVYCVMVAIGDDVVATLFGSNWAPAGTLLRVLAVGGVFRALMQGTYWGYLASGHTASMLRFDAIALPILSVGIVAGSGWGTMGVAVAHSVGYAIYWAVGLGWFARVLGIRSRPQYTAAGESIAIVGAPAGLFAYLGASLVSAPWLACVVGGVGAASWLLASYWAYPKMRTTVNYYLRSLRPQRSGAV